MYVNRKVYILLLLGYYMKNTNKTAGKTATESVGVTETQNQEIINIVYQASRSVDKFICGVNTGVYENTTKAMQLILIAVDLLKTAEKQRIEGVD